ncbi:AAA family ATPase [Candidatus Poribacteria bacterium]|nr:AAA family ATPase [Candidatus Poribacteria bacterium]
MKDSTFITRVVLKNYKSIAACNVRLGPLMFLVGPNGAGKSNFLDALRFVAEALRTSLDYALRDRGGINEVHRRSGGHPTHFSIRIDFTLREGTSGHYAFRIGARPRGGYEVQTEECVLRGPELLSQEEYFRVENGAVTTSVKVAPAATTDRLYLVNASGLAEFRPVYEAFSWMGFYSLNPDKIRDPQPPDPGELLMRDGSNLAGVLSQLSKPVKGRIEEYLAKVVPGVHGVDVKGIGPKETLEFRQGIAGSKYPWRFQPTNMSDGTLRVLGILVALFQAHASPSIGGNHNAHPRVPLVGIEEPEIALHPAAVGVLLDSLKDASHSTQILVTSHSPDLLDDNNLAVESILAVVAEEGTTKIGPVDEAGRSALRDRLYTAGELLRLNQLAPDPKVVASAMAKQLHLFDFEKSKPHRKKDKEST